MKVARLKTRRCRRRVACVESEVMKITSKHMTEWVQSSPCFLGCCAAEGLRQQHSGLIRKKHKSQCHQKQSQESKNNTSPLFSCTSNQQHAYDRGVQLNPPPPQICSHACARACTQLTGESGVDWCDQMMFKKKKMLPQREHNTVLQKHTLLMCPSTSPTQPGADFLFYLGGLTFTGEHK